MRLFAGVLVVDRRGWLLLQERDEHPVITLLYGARDTEHNQAVVLRDLLG